jgi:hypothetical protein
LFRARRHAASVAARVAAVLLSIFQLGRVFRRASHAGQLMLVAALVPIALASAPSSSAAHQAVAAPLSHSAMPAPTHHPEPSPQGGRETPMALPEGPAVPAVSGVPLPLQSVPIGGATSTVNGAIEELERSLRLSAPQLPTPTLPPKVGGNPLPSGVGNTFQP